MLQLGCLISLTNLFWILSAAFLLYNCIFFYKDISKRKHFRIYSEVHFVACTVSQTEHNCSRRMHVTCQKKRKANRSIIHQLWRKRVLNPELQSQMWPTRILRLAGCLDQVSLFHWFPWEWVPVQIGCSGGVCHAFPSFWKAFLKALLPSG